jgi:hypothetical protein
MEQRKEIVELSVEQLEAVSGGENKNCTYADKDYSPGSVLDMPGGSKTCRADGTWF